MTPIKKRSLAAAFIMALVFITLLYSENSLDKVKVLFESGHLTLMLWAYVVGSVAMHTLIVIKPRIDAYGFFEKYSNTVYSIATYGIGGSTSIALLKGLFFQVFYEGVFFKGFSNFDISSIFILSSFLLIYSLLNSTKILSEAIFYTSTSEVYATEEK
ncbi:hypothetical protein [uncultured Pseudomonas sp.]|uniref:hypothetical protein n=1 Tax=uncultured Pseudomonas sp. TaxID=114707 RepID=UPI0030DC8253|tara:strand:- start:324 stop:797 length:474 start_codon:yes stop_codon:yes gene_type:complete